MGFPSPAVVPSGLIAEPLDLLLTTINRSAAWQAWAGTDYAERVHLNANRSQIETLDGVVSYIDRPMVTPFIVIWMPEWQIPPRRCIAHYSLTFLVQDKATSRHEHNQSAIDYTTLLGGLLDDLVADFGQGSLESLDCTNMVMTGQPTRVEITKAGDSDNDMWTSTFHLIIGPEV